jgi:hypothetical protein
LSQNKLSTHQQLSLGKGILGYGVFAILFLGIWDMCPLNYWDMGYCIAILGIFRDIFGFLLKINIRDMGYLPILF